MRHTSWNADHGHTHTHYRDTTTTKATMCSIGREDDHFLKCNIKFLCDDTYAHTHARHTHRYAARIGLHRWRASVTHSYKIHALLQPCCVEPLQKHTHCVVACPPMLTLSRATTPAVPWAWRFGLLHRCRPQHQHRHRRRAEVTFGVVAPDHVRCLPARSGCAGLPGHRRCE